MQARAKLPAGKLAVGFPAKRDEAVLNAGGARCESVLFNFASDGGAIGDISFGRKLPAGAIVHKITVDVQTAVLGATAVTLKAGSLALSAATDLTALSGIASIAPLDADGVKVVSEGELKISIATAAATAGKLRLFVHYVLPND